VWFKATKYCNHRSRLDLEFTIATDHPSASALCSSSWWGKCPAWNVHRKGNDIPYVIILQYDSKGSFFKFKLFSSFEMLLKEHFSSICTYQWSNKAIRQWHKVIIAWILLRFYEPAWRYKFILETDSTPLRPSFQYYNKFTEIDYMEYIRGQVDKTRQNVLIHGIGMLVLPVSVTVEMIRLGNAESMMVASLSCLRRVSVSVVVETNIMLIK